MVRHRCFLRIFDGTYKVCRGRFWYIVLLAEVGTIWKNLRILHSQPVDGHAFHLCVILWIWHICVPTNFCHFEYIVILAAGPKTS